MKFVYLGLVFMSCSVSLSTQDSFPPIHNGSQELIKYIENDYNKLILPNISSGVPLDVKIDIYVISIEPIHTTDMTFTVQMYLRQYWKDNSLRFKRSNTSCTNYVSLHPELISKVWVPDTYIENEVTKDVRSRALVIFNNGQILLSERVNIKAYCSLDLKRYPMDVQECTLKFQSYSYAACELQYTWFYEGKGKSLRVSNAIELPNYHITGLNTLTQKDILKTGSFSRLLATFQFTHRIMYVLMRDYLPAAFIVVTSWLSFYIDPSASPARVSLAVITVLSIATQLRSTFTATPEVSYIKSIDWYVIGCFLFVFAAMIEYGFTHSYGEETLSLRNKTEKHVGISNPTVPQEDGNDEVMNETRENTIRAAHDRMTRQNGNAYSSNFSSSFNLNDTHHPQRDTIKRASSFEFLKGWMFVGYRNLSSADAISRVAFPLLFLLFNVIYWVLVFLL